MRPNAIAEDQIFLKMLITPVSSRINSTMNTTPITARHVAAGRHRVDALIEHLQFAVGERRNARLSVGRVDTEADQLVAHRILARKPLIWSMRASRDSD